MNLLIIGGNSDTGIAVAKVFAQKEKADIFLASRNLGELEKKAEDIRIRFQVNTKALFFDVLDTASHNAFYHELDSKPDVVVMAVGYLGNQVKAQSDITEAKKIIDTNFSACIGILETIAADFEKRGHGVIIGLSSVAGERGRKSNYIYGSAKGAFTIYLSGLRNRLAARGVRVITVLPGFIRTKMTRELELPGKLTATPEEVAKDIHAAFISGRDILYTRWYWKWIMRCIRWIPEFLFKRTNI